MNNSVCLNATKLLTQLWFCRESNTLDRLSNHHHQSLQFVRESELQGDVEVDGGHLLVLGIDSDYI